ncbi:MBL fold metallo-hydrolase [Geothrix sp. 21YS21S-4]|uniref:MBL fold metallo-hydrolase n=1 Tax=Geothrix sp. 21YS21S-4 TaxID=3068889 RepID=UPI0027BA216E|nr:MBL fold metallo-hydrolase [Geothrix sp. 21YS21S-4]
MLNLETFPVGPLGCNCSLLWDPATGQGVVVDPGGDGAKIRKRVETLGFTVTALLHTHAHFDHVGATRELQDLWQCPAHLHADDGFLIDALPRQTGLFGMPAIPQPEMADLNAGDRHGDLTTLHTPGHTPGSCCFHGEFARGRVLLAGDTLFRGGVGRTDLWGGNWDQLEASIRRELYVLDGATLVIPGHGPATTIGEEATGNPFVRGHS